MSGPADGVGRIGRIEGLDRTQRTGWNEGIDGPAPPPDERAELRRLSHEMEGVFLRQLFAAMRSGVPEGGLIESTPGEETFRSLLDDRLASIAAEKMERGIGEALYRQLCRRLDASRADTPSTDATQITNAPAQDVAGTRQGKPAEGAVAPERGNRDGWQS